MDNNDCTNRVGRIEFEQGNSFQDRVLAYRTVYALECIANFCDAIMYGLILYSICYTAIFVVEKFRGGNE